MSELKRKIEYLCLSSESDDSDIEFTYMAASCLVGTSTKEWKNLYLERRNEYGEFYTLLNDLTAQQFINYFRMTRNQYNEILEYIRDDIEGCDTNYRKAIEPEKKLAICLRYLATGNSFMSLGYSYKVSARSVSKIIVQVCDAIRRRMKSIVMPEPTVEDFKEVSENFASKWNFNNCIGAIGGRHVFIKAPKNSGSDLFNCKGRFSIVLLAMVDANMRILHVDVGGKGRFSEGGIFASSFISSRLKDSTRLPEDQPLYEGGKPMPFVAVADASFPLQKHLMRPYPGKQSLEDREKRIYNYRLWRARRIVDSTFGVLAAKWRVYSKPFEIPVQKVDKIVLATCVLHNFLLNHASGAANQTLDDDVIDNQTNTCFGDFSATNTSAKREYFALRDDFKEFFSSSVGSISWQDEIQ